MTIHKDVICNNVQGAVEFNRVYTVDALSLLRSMPDECVHSIVTSPPYYGLRSYTSTNNDFEIGKSQTIEQYVESLVAIFDEAKRVLLPTGTFWLNIGDTYARSAGDDTKKNIDTKIQTGRSVHGSTLYQRGNNHPPEGMKAKDLMLIPHRVAIALQDSGWFVRQDNVWWKKNPLPDAAKDRTWRAHEYVFQLSKSPRYYYDLDAANVDSADNKRKRNRHSVWQIATQKRRVSGQSAAMPEAIARYCIAVSTRLDDIVLDPFMGGGTTASVANRMGRQFIGAEINKDLAYESIPYILNLNR